MLGQPPVAVHLTTPQPSPNGPSEEELNRYHPPPPPQYRIPLVSFQVTLPIAGCVLRAEKRRGSAAGASVLVLLLVLVLVLLSLSRTAGATGAALRKSSSARVRAAGLDMSAGSLGRKPAPPLPPYFLNFSRAHRGFSCAKGVLVAFPTETRRNGFDGGAGARAVVFLTTMAKKWQKPRPWRFME